MLCFVQLSPFFVSIFPLFPQKRLILRLKERFRHCFVTERKRQWEVREALKVTNHRTPRGNIKIWARADTGRERQLCQLGEDSFLVYKIFDTCK